MAVYKVIQDIEAEDKLLGPLTLKGFIYFAIAGVLAFINVRLLIAGGPIYVRLAVIFVLFFPMLLFGVLASPLGRDQPTEVWLLSHVRFMLKQHLRNWDKAGVDQLVTITAPKRAELHLTKDFSQSEVQSRLQALATTLDSRGWVVKNSNVNLNDKPDYLADGQSDRLVAPSNLARVDQVLDIHPSDDILDEQNNATAQKFNELMQVADTQRKEAVREKINEYRAAGAGQTIISPPDDTAKTDSTADDSLPPGAEELLEREHKRLADIHRRSASFHTKAEQAAARKTPAPTELQTQAANDPQNTVTPQPKLDASQSDYRLLRSGFGAGQAASDEMTESNRAAKLELAQSGNALSVASIAHLANRVGQVRQIGPGEVEISLH